MTDDEVLYELRGPVAWLTINRPAHRNAMNEAVVEGLPADSADEEDRASVAHARRASGLMPGRPHADRDRW
jgi:enoyl-CoA hydratase/carnithine racemase